jgi:hypothetical protein
MHLALTHEFRCHFIWYQCFRCTICLQVIPVAISSLCEICGFHSSEDSSQGLLGCDAV